MSTMRSPVGPEDKRVYLRRRLLVLAGLLAVIVAIVLVIVKPGSSSGSSASQSVELPADVSEKVASPEPGASDAPATCANGDLLVEAVTNLENYGPGEIPELSLSVTNRGDAACTAELGTAGMRFEISSGPEQYWNSTDCLANPTNLPVILQPAEVITTEPILWDRTRSAPDTCEAERDPVPGEGASYHLFVEVAGVRSADSAQFILQ